MSRHSDHTGFDDDHDDLGITRTEADRLSHTRFGPRPVPEGHKPPRGPRESRRVPPSGPVSPDGARGYPRPSRLAKWVVWGGTGIAAAALTAGTVYAARHVADLLSGDDHAPKRPTPQPRPPETQPRMQMPSPAERAALSDRPRDLRHDRFRDDQPPRPRRKPAPRKGLMREIEENAASLSQGVDNVMGSVSAAVTGFRTVAAQAAEIMREFGDAAAMVRGIMGDAPRADTPKPRATPHAARSQTHSPAGPDRHGAHMPNLRDDAAAHDPLRDAQFDPRTHRL